MSSNRIQQRMDALRAIGRKALIPYIVAGDPTPSVTVPAMHAMVEAGADIIELGMPFSDPFADVVYWMLFLSSDRPINKHLLY